MLRHERGLPVRTACGELSFRRIGKAPGGRDCYAMRRRSMQNQQLAQENGLDAFLAGQTERIAFLEKAL
jgi:hypothetical protein